jgi:hypothetical protein
VRLVAGASFSQPKRGARAVSRLVERIESHGVVSLLAATRQVLAQIVSPPGDPDAFESLERLRHVLERLANLIDDAEPTLVSPDLLQRLLPAMAGLRAAVDQYAATGLSIHLTTAEANLDALIAEVGWPLAYSFKKPSGIRQYASAYHDGLDRYVRLARKQVDDLAAQIADLQASVDAARALVASAAAEAAAGVTAGAAEAEQQMQAAVTDSESRTAVIAAAAEQRMAALSAAVDGYTASLASLTATYNAQFVAEQTTRQAQADTALAEESGKHNAVRAEAQAVNQAALADAQAANQAAMAGWTATAQTSLESLVEKGKDADRLLGAIGERALAGGFGRYADQQRSSADWLRVVAFVFGALAVVSTLAVALAAVNASFEWTMLLRALVAVPLLFVAGYAAQQSGHHRERERDARRNELELAAIDPYLVSLDPAQRNQIKADLAVKMFAQPRTDPTPALAEKLLELLKEAIKKG